MRSRQNRRGNAVMIGVTFLAMLGFGALGVDVGFAETCRSELQASVDAAALGAVGELDGTYEGMDRAITMARQLSTMNQVLGSPVELGDAEIVLGVFDRETATFYEDDDPELVNAVRIDKPGQPVTPFLAMVAFGRGLTYSAQSTAHRPWAYGRAGSANCFLPMAVPDCHVEGLGEGEMPPPIRFNFTPTPSDNVAWGDPKNNPNSADIKDQLSGQCQPDKEIRVDEPMYVNEGSHTSALHEIADLLNDRGEVSPDGWPPELGAMPDRSWPNANDAELSDVEDYAYGNVIQGPVALVDAGPCSGSNKFTGELDITGITWAIIYDVKSNGAGKGEKKKKNLFVQLDPVNDHEIWGDYDPDATGGNVLGLGDAQLAN
jgi:hypothetical protein